MHKHHRYRHALTAVALAASIGTMVAAPAAYADDPGVVVGYDSDGNPILTTDADPDEPADLPADSPWPDVNETTFPIKSPNSPRCDAASSTTVTNLPNKLKVDWSDAVINDSKGSATYTVTAQTSTTFTWGLSASVSVEGKALIFAKVSATINGSIQHSKTTTYGSSVSVQVPAHSTMKADRGMWQEKFAYKYYKIDTSCRETTSSGTGQAPYKTAWHIYS
jgi:hypothetical protein